MSCTGDANDGNHGMGSQRRYESVVNDQSIEMNGNSMFISGWDHLGGSSMVTQNHYSFVPGNQVVGTSSHMIQSDSSFFESGSQFTCFGSGNFSEMMGSFCQDVGSQIGNAGYPPNYALNKQDHSERAQMVIRNDIQILEDQQLSAAATSLNGKRRRRGSDSDSSFDPNQSLEAEPPKNSGAESSDIVKEEVEKKAKFEQNSDAKLQCKQAAKQGKDNLQGGEAPKENYIHVRARRGQATNSHSLAERVRREKISERMRLLQELVPGCNKITGKAVMLDEIINYVQSLQQQVEFLSMKLATVNPDVNIDIETILSKDVLHSRSTNAAILGLNPSLNTHSYGHRYFQASIPAIPNTNMQFPPLSNSGLDDEFQTLFQMGFNPNPAIDSLGPNGRLQPEL